MASSALVAAVGVIGHISDGALWRPASRPVSEQLARLGATAARQDVWEACYPGLKEPDRVGQFCNVFKSDPSADLAVGVFGDSHAEFILPAFEKVGDEAVVWHSSLGGCPPLEGVYVVAGNYDTDVCREMAREQLRFAMEKRLDVVVLVGRWSLYTHRSIHDEQSRYLLTTSRIGGVASIEDSRRAFETLLDRTLANYRKAGIAVILVEQIPQQNLDPKLAIERMAFFGVAGDASRFVAETSVLITEDRERMRFSDAALRRRVQDGVSLLSFDDLFAQGDRYHWAMRGDSWYFDHNHLSPVGARQLQDRVYEAVMAARKPRG
ncbi:MAG: SGNH hydrolase domain-containing protein [Caulobacter sp.]|nr:SGNH hydrolase domain-containing protein [Caulobacter sp.]